MTKATELVASIYRSFNTGDVPKVLAAFDHDIEWRTPTSLPWSEGIYRGPGGVARYFESFAGDLSDATVDPDSIDGLGDIVVARGFERATVRSTGLRFEARFVHVWRVEDGRVGSMEGVADTAAIVSAFGAAAAT